MVERREQNETLLADQQGPDQGGWIFLVVLALIYLVLQVLFRRGLS